MRIAMLGTGIMGSAMARRALRAGHQVVGWSVPLSDAKALVDDGAELATTAAEAARGADLVITMVPDAPAIESFARGRDGFLEAISPGGLWIQSSTVGVAPADRLIALAARHAVGMIDAPVLGSREPAERGELVILASGEEGQIDSCMPYFDAISRRVMRLGPAGRGSRMKIVTNHWIMGAIAAIAETMALASGLGLDGGQFLEALEGTQMDMGYAQIKGAMMAQRRYPAQASLATGAKDAVLANEAARAVGLPARVSGAAAELLTTALALREPGTLDDMAAAYEGALVPSPSSSNI